MFELTCILNGCCGFLLKNTADWFHSGVNVSTAVFVLTFSPSQFIIQYGSAPYMERRKKLFCKI